MIRIYKHRSYLGLYFVTYNGLIVARGLSRTEAESIRSDLLHKVGA